MNADNFNVAWLLRMRHSPVSNYVIPGLTSWLIGEPSDTGTVRLFECSREHQEVICPHSHRFDFQCWVLAGSVRNRLWRKTYANDSGGDMFRETILRYEGEFGHYEHEHGAVCSWRYADSIHSEGSCYRMESDEVHSIYFSRGARVLFFEGEKVSDVSIVLEPVVDGEAVPTFKVEPWMFRKTGRPHDHPTHRPHPQPHARLPSQSVCVQGPPEADQVLR